MSFQPIVLQQTEAGLKWTYNPADQQKPVDRSELVTPPLPIQDQDQVQNQDQTPNVMNPFEPWTVPVYGPFYPSQPTRTGGIFESLLYHDQFSFLEELRREQAQEDKMQAQAELGMQHQKQFTPPKYYETITIEDDDDEEEQQLNNQGQAGTVNSKQFVALHPIQYQPDPEQSGPKVQSTLFNNRDHELMPPPPPPQQTKNYFTLMPKLFEKEKDPIVLNVLPPILREELKTLAISLDSISMATPIQEIFPGVYKLSFYVNFEDIFMGQLEVAVTDDYPAEAPVVNFETTGMPPGALIKLRRKIAEISFSFRVEEIAKKWFTVCFDICKIKLYMIRQKKEGPPKLGII